MDSAPGLDLDRIRIDDGSMFELGNHPTDDVGGWTKDQAKEAAARLEGRLSELQELLWAQGASKVLVVLQAIDAGGKDGTIRKVFRGMNPSGVRVANFKRPSEHELAHDFLWRIHQQTPADGELVIFNRSHYEDVLVVRVFDLVPEARWRARYGHIVDFERLLVDEGTTIVKVFLHISKDEQRARLQKRLDDPAKNWKFDPVDLEVRRRWDDYQAAFSEMIQRTARPHAPWYVVPADHKWYRNLVVSEILVQTLEGLGLRPPDAVADLEGIVVE